jgi:pimeloyl-ACP methyl ester carboxylesterase
LIHGREDEILPPVCSRQVHALAHAPKALHLLTGGHGLDESAAEVERLVRDWLSCHLAEDGPQ